MGWVRNAIETMKAARPKGVWSLALLSAFAGAVGVYLLSTPARGRDPDYQRIADYRAGRTLYTEALKAHHDAAKLFVLLIPAIAAVTITFLADTLGRSSVQFPVLLYLGWAGLAVSWVAALMMLHSGRQVAYAVALHLIYEHFDPKESQSHRQRSYDQDRCATWWKRLMYAFVFVSLGLVASFVGVNVGQVGEEELEGEPVVAHLQIERVGQDSVQLGLDLWMAGEGELYAAHPLPPPSPRSPLLLML